MFQFNQTIIRKPTVCRLPDNGLVKLKHVGAFVVNLNVNFKILKQFKFALVGQIKDLILFIVSPVITLMTRFLTA